MNETDTPSESAVLAPNVIQSLERASIDSQVATAMNYPRNLQKFKIRSREMVTFDKETAESCIYHRPVGKDPETGKQKIAEGESIRMAEIVAATFGNLRVSARIIEQTPRFVKCEGVAHDLQSNYAAKSEVVEPTVTKNGSPYSERQAAVVAKVALSKAFRDAVFRVVPKSMCKFLKNAAQEVIAGGLTLSERRANALTWADAKKIDRDRFFAGLGVKGEAEIGEDQLLMLVGLRTSLKENDITLDEAFPPLSKAPDMTAGNPPQMFPAGGGTVTEPAKPTTAEKPDMSNPLTQIRAKLAEAKATEADLIALLRLNGVDASLGSLEEILMISPAAIESVLTKWDEFKKKLKPQSEIDRAKPKR